MLRLRIIHHLRTTIFLVVLAVILGAIGTLIWANSTGMPKSWRQAVERAISKHGLHVEIGGLSYHPLEGIVARQVKVFSDADRDEVISRLEGLILDFDNAKLAKGEVQISKVKLSKARLLLPIDPDDPDSKLLEITDIEGEFIPPGNRYIEIRNARGTIAGIKLVLNAKIADDASSDDEPVDPPNPSGQRKLMDQIVQELEQWSFDADAPPEIRIEFVGKRSAMDQARASIQFQANSVGKNQHTIERIEADAELHRNFLSVHSLTARNGERQLHTRLDYDLDKNSGRFDLKSSLEIPVLLRSWLGMKPIDKLTIAGGQQIEASGQFLLESGKAPDIRATGLVRCDSAHLSGVHFDQIETAFAWHNGDIFFKDLSLVRHDGEVRGKAMIEGNMVRMDIHSTLLPEYYRPLFLETPIEEIIDSFEIRKESTMEMKLEGGFDLTDLRSWAYTGTACFRDLKYRNVGLAELKSTVSLSSGQMDFTDGSITFDYSDYPMAKRFSGPDRGQLSFNSVRYFRGENRTLSFDGVEGTFWPAPLCRLFLNETSDHLEKYKFHRPPKITGSGMVDLVQKKDTLIDLDFTSAHQAEYVFLDAPVNISRPSGKVIITDTGTNIRNLKLSAFEGSLIGNMNFPHGKPMDVNLQVSKLSMDSISKTYDLDMKCGGLLVGDLAFTMMPAEVSTMQGKGRFNLEKSELFSVPIFGPLSHLMQAVLKDKRAGAERAKDATANFVIKDGIVATGDFNTATTSLKFVGEGWVDLDKKTMDMTMRMNGRGLLGIFNIALRPFYGLFQFRGTGTLKDPVWERVAFTKPNEKVQQMLTKDR